MGLTYQNTCQTELKLPSLKEDLPSILSAINTVDKDTLQTVLNLSINHISFLIVLVTPVKDKLGYRLVLLVNLHT